MAEPEAAESALATADDDSRPASLRQRTLEDGPGGPDGEVSAGISSAAAAISPTGATAAGSAARPAAAIATRLPLEAYGAALASLPGMGPARLTALARSWPLAEAWDRVLADSTTESPAVVQALGVDATSLPARWASTARRIDPGERLDAHQQAGIGISVLGAASYPPSLAGDVEPPVVLFHRGRPDVLPGPRVAIIGTRRCTRYGRDVARAMGHDLAAAGVRVVSGLALGIDGCAHEGALAADAAPPVAVVGSGLDVIYPRRHAELWQRVEAVGVVLTEGPLGARPEKWRFPSRNRLLAALADVVVVVESHAKGGSMYTVDEALARDVTVMAVPGPVHSPASRGCNQLLVDSMAVARDAADVLSLLGLSTPAVTRGGADDRPAPSPSEKMVLEAFAWQPAALEQLAARTGHSLGDLAEALLRLEVSGWISGNGGWYERVARPDR